MDYRQSLEYLYGLQRFGIKLGLENVRRLLDRLGHPEAGYGIVHVAGTNGKGSVCATVAEILGRAGYRTGLYTSPHLHAFTERIRINGAEIAEAEVARLAAGIRALAGGIPATFFEFTTALALLHFRRQEVDFAVLETGMGGRLDATNAATPLLCVITTICHDHREHLGPDLPAIASEKGGIIKPGVPVLIGRQEPAALEVLLDRARTAGAPALVLGRDFAIDAVPDGSLSFRGPDLELQGLRPGLAGAHQHDNIALALAAAALLRRRGTALPEAALRAGVEQVCWPGRLEWWRGQRSILLDGAHNEGGGRALAAYLASREVAGWRWVVGMKGDKNPEHLLGSLLPHVCALYCTVPPVEQPLAPSLLAEAALAAGKPATVHAAPEAALTAALRERRRDEVVLVAGSLFLVAAAREFLLNEERRCL